MSLKGIDISSYQGQPDFPALKDNLDFIIIKASEGTGFKDPQFSRNQSEARRVGLLSGYYHFGRPDLGNTPQAEAEWFLKTIGVLKTSEVLVLDIEVTYGDLVNWSKAFLDAITNKLNGYKPLIYLNQSQIQTHNWEDIYYSDYGLWVASYDNQPEGLKFDAPWPTVAMKQYTSSAHVNGIAGNVDADTFFGNVNTFKAYGVKPNIAPPDSVTTIIDQTPIPLNTVTVLEEYKSPELQQVRSFLKSKDQTIHDFQLTDHQQVVVIDSYQKQVEQLTLDLDKVVKDFKDYKAQQQNTPTPPNPQIPVKTIKLGGYTIQIFKP